MIEVVWISLIATALIGGAFSQHLDAVAQAMQESAQQAVTLSVGLVGTTCWWLGLLHILRQAGALDRLSATIQPLFRRLFPDIPPKHPALGAIVLNMTANILGLGNVATPFGLQAMTELNRLNPTPGKATPAMVAFLAINTSGLAIIPTGMIALRASMGSHMPGNIVLPTILSTLTAATVGLLAARLLMGIGNTPSLPHTDASPATASASPPPAPATTPTPQSRWLGRLLALAFTYSFITALYAAQASEPLSLGHLLHQLSSWLLLILLMLILVIGVYSNVPMYQAMVAGAQEGIPLLLKVFPNLLVMLVAIGMWRVSGGLKTLTTFCEPWSHYLGIPAEVLPMILMRPLSGQGSFAVAADLMQQFGPDSLVGHIASTLMGTTETTFYVLALYLGVAGIGSCWQAVLACLLADIGGTLMAVGTCRFFCP
jgi:spore maturation protein SpmA